MMYVDLKPCMYPSEHGMSAAKTLTYRYINNKYVTNMSVPVCTWYIYVYPGQNVYIHVHACKYTYDQCTYMFILAFVSTMYVHGMYNISIVHTCTCEFAQADGKTQ